MKMKKKVRYPSMLQISVPLEAYDALAALSEFEGSPISQIGRRAVVLYLVQNGLMQPPQLKVANQQVAN